MIILCRVNRFRVMIDFFRDGSAHAVFCKTVGLVVCTGGHV